MSYTLQNVMRPPYTLDSAVTRRIIAGGWFAAAWGVAVFQALLLAQTWSQYQQAMPTACVAGTWVFGGVVGLRLRYALRRAAFPGAPLLWGAAFVGTALGWWIGIAPWLAAHPVTGQGPLPTSVFLLGAVALVMGVTSTCWLLQSRPWPVIGEAPGLARGLICLTLGLFVAWTWPVRAALLGILLLLPLIGLDLYPADRSPFPMRGGLVDALLERSGGDPATWLPLQLERRGSARWWWLSYLLRRRYIPPTVLAFSLAVVAGAIWYAVPTPFAFHLLRTHQVGTLAWLVAGQLVALMAGWYVFSRSCGTLGPPDRLIPQERQRPSWNLARLALFLAAASLVLLGLPFLQAPWSLGLSLALYTLAGFTWNILLARLRPSVSTQAFSLRHLLLGSGGAVRLGQLSYERALEERATLILASWEGVLLALAAPLLGYLIDQTTFDDILVLVGLGLCLVFAALLLAVRLFQRGPALPGRAA